MTWPAMEEKVFSARFLRQECPCAACRHELTGERLLDPSSVPNDLVIVSSEIIGQYALGFQFSDGHSTGIYTFEYLKNLHVPVNS
ncbi:MAG: hypothetical protein KCHDKBKB_01459 [Elusimicrobia bacterium]|nr:hypothetical protein [Elusimicrobiota bacterium]